MKSATKTLEKIERLEPSDMGRFVTYLGNNGDLRRGQITAFLNSSKTAWLVLSDGQVMAKFENIFKERE